MIYKLRRITHAIWVYLNQSLNLTAQEQSEWKIKRFFYLYQIRLLESCWSQDAFEPNHESSGQDGYKTGN
jgi:hypothetical protein